MCCALLSPLTTPEWPATAPTCFTRPRKFATMRASRALSAHALRTMILITAAGALSSRAIPPCIAVAAPPWHTRSSHCPTPPAAPTCLRLHPPQQLPLSCAPLPLVHDGSTHHSTDHCFTFGAERRHRRCPCPCRRRPHRRSRADRVLLQQRPLSCAPLLRLCDGSTHHSTDCCSR